MAHPPNLRELAAHLDPVAQQYRTIVEPYTGDDTLNPALQLAPVAGEIAVLTGYVLNTVGDLQGTGQHDLESLAQLGRRLAELVDVARRREPVPPGIQRP
ncbi:hypothetical protein GCM10009682_40590 [Luedemannella flava]|uniref:Uncharacterized protein n=1 Tax=Luedemannella flava TaxID=349316 RepID=A0ABN2M9A7_9ACTN